MPRLSLSVLPLTLMLALPAVQSWADDLDRTPLEATTAQGDKVRLYPTGKWEYVDKVKAAAARDQAAKYPENQVRPIAAQGGWVPGSRAIMPGDKDYNRGSLNPKGR